MRVSSTSPFAKSNAHNGRAGLAAEVVLIQVEASVLSGIVSPALKEGWLASKLFTYRKTGVDGLVKRILLPNKRKASLDDTSNGKS